MAWRADARAAWPAAPAGMRRFAPRHGSFAADPAPRGPGGAARFTCLSATSDNKDMAFTPPDPEAVREAMAEPPRRGGRAASMLALLAVAALIGAFLMPDNGDDGTSSPVDPNGHRYVDSYNHPVGFRFLIPLQPSASGQHGELQTMLVFGYTVLRENHQAAKDSIRDHWNDAASAVAKVLCAHTRLDFVNDLAEINREVARVLNAVLFPDDVAQVQTINWDHFTFS